MSTPPCAHSARDLEQRTAQFLAHTRRRLTTSELERYAYLANEPAPRLDASIATATLEQVKRDLHRAAYTINEAVDDLDVLQMRIES